MGVSPRFRTVCALTLLCGAVLTALGLALDKPARIWTFSESGPFEILTIVSWLLLAALCLVAAALPWRRRIAPGLLALAAGAREADLHKAFTPESIFKLKLYLTSAAPPLTKIAAGIVTLLILAVLITMLVRAWRALSSRANWRQDWTRTTALGLVLLAFCGSLDRVQNIVHDLTGNWLPHTLGNVIPAWEEGYESLLPLIFVAVLLQHRAATMNGRPLWKQPQAHLFFPFIGAVGGAENRATEIALGLREHYDADARLWSTSSRVHPEMRRRGVRAHTPLQVFLRGSFIFLGVFWKPKAWLRRSRPERLTVIVNAMDLDAFRRNLPIYREMTPDLRLVYTSELLRRLCGVDGAIHVSPIDLQRFSPAANPQPSPAGTLRVGRHSRDALEKHQLLYDPELYASLAQEGVSFDLMGASCLQPLLPQDPRIRLRPQLQLEAGDYLRGLDCFFYRTGAFLDPAARVVWEAMACGLPVVCHRYGGHADRIKHGENGFLFDDQREAFEILRRLRDDPALRQRIGGNARATMERLFAPSRLKQMYGSYISDAAPAIDY